jgi:DNA-binding NtrC family response regulator
MTVLVVQLSDSFAEFWGSLSRDLGIDVRVVGGEDMGAVGAEVSAVVLAVGGMEHDAVDWLDQHELPATLPVLAVGADPGRHIATRLVRHGATDYYAFPADLEIFFSGAEAALDRQREWRRRNAASVAEVKPEAFAAIVGESPPLKTVLARAARLLPHPDATALIVGETGTGKELLARAIHEGGPRRRGPFVAVNSSALPEHLVESELFGHEKGAFTDAYAPKPGLFEVAEGGTLFLDEIGTLPVDLQAKLLRVLEDKLIRRVGGTKWRRANVRILAATNKRLEEAIRAGGFRQDLYYRLSVVTLTLPPLRERGDDVILIATDLLTRTAQDYGLPVPVLDARARGAISAQPWLGNVRELKNAVERALLLSPPGKLDLTELIQQGETATAPAAGALPFPGRLETIVVAAARATLELCEGNRSAAARRLGISRRRLRRLLHLDDGTARSPGANRPGPARSDPPCPRPPVS